MTLAKRKGECAELAFLLKAALLGLTVCKPYGDSARFDFVIEIAGLLRRIQVKSTASARRLRSSSARSPRYAYTLNTATGLHRRHTYSPADVDFLAAYIVPEDVWYIIPVEAVAGRRTLRLCPSDPRRRNRYEPYREAWRLLLA